MINNILMSLYSILPNEEKNEFYYFKQADNYLSALLPYKLTDITNVDNFLITTGTINIKYDILNINQLMNTSYIALTYTSENNLKTYQFYKVLTKEIRKEYCVFSVEKDLWANGLCQNAMFDSCKVLRCNRNIGTGVFDNVNNLKSNVPIYTMYDSAEHTPITDLAFIVECVTKVNNSTIFQTQVSTSTHLYLCDFPLQESEFPTIDAMISYIQRIFAMQNPNRTEDSESNIIKCFIIEKKYINYDASKNNYVYLKFGQDENLKMKGYPLIGGLKDTNIILSNLNNNYKNYFGTKGKYLLINNKNTSQKIIFRTITSNDDLSLQLIYEDNILDITDQFLISLTTNDGNLTTQQEIQKNLKQIANVASGAFQIIAGGAGLISGASPIAGSAAIVTGASQIAGSFTQSLSQGINTSKSTSGDGYVNFINNDILIYSKPFYIISYESLFDETENAKKKGINFNSFIDFDTIFTKDYIIENTGKTFIQAVVNLPNVDIENKVYIESLLQNGIYIKAV